MAAIQCDRNDRQWNCQTLSPNRRFSLPLRPDNLCVGSADGARRFGRRSIDTTNTTTSDATGASVYLAANGLNEAYSYDAFGNLQQSGNYNFLQGYTLSNQLSGWSYDASGNLLNNGLGANFTYDAENRISAVSGNTNVYDSEGNRIEKAGSSTTDYVYFGGKQLARLSGGQWTDLIYGVGQMLAEVPGTQTGTPTYRMLDHLGTAVGTLTSTGVLLSTADYAPFGELFAGGTIDPYRFTGKERDAESGNDYFGARYYVSSMGRFMSPDDGSDFDPESPQNWNLYSYVRNDPLSGVDENGRQVTVCSFVNNADGSTGQSCNTISDAAYAAGVAAQQAQNANNGPYSGIQAPGGARPDGIITDNGQAVGTATWSPDPPSSLASGQAIPGDMGLSFVAIGGATKLAGMGIKAGLDFVFKAGAEAGGKSLPNCGNPQLQSPAQAVSLGNLPKVDFLRRRRILIL